MKQLFHSSKGGGLPDMDFLRGLTRSGGHSLVQGAWFDQSADKQTGRQTQTTKYLLPGRCFRGRSYRLPQKRQSHSRQDSWRVGYGCVWCWWWSEFAHCPADTQNTDTEPGKSAAAGQEPHFHACSQLIWSLAPLEGSEETNTEFRNRLVHLMVCMAEITRKVC